MLKNFVKIAIRNLLRSKGFSVINILGLAVGMASAILILLWIQNEMSYDQFHEKKDRIVEVWNKATFDGNLNCWNTTPKVLARTLERDFPEVEQSVRVDWNNDHLFSVGEKRITLKGSPVDSNFFQVFSFRLLKGQTSTVLNDQHNIVLTESTARKLFGNEEPMGKIIKLDNADNFTVTGIVKDLPNNTRFNFEYLLPWSYVRFKGNDDNYWGNNSTRTYALLKPGINLEGLQKKLKTLKQKYQPEETKWEMFVYPITKWRLYSSFKNGVEDGGRIVFVRLFGIIACFILLIACINFMNLSTARSEKRAKEVGIRKVVGAHKNSLILQFIGESILLAFIAGIIALLIVQLALPGFNTLTSKQLYIQYGNILFWATGLGFIALTGIVAGSYPAFYLSSFQPVSVLKGTFKKAHALVTPRKILVVLQFTFAIILIICTIIVRQQINYAQNRESGYNKDNLVFHFLTGDLDKNYNLVKNDLLASNAVVSVTKTSAPLTQSWSDGWGQEWEGKDPNDKTDFRRYNADEDLVKTIGLTLVKGRDFNLKEYPTDSTAMMINESALKVFKFKEPLGQIIKDNGRQWHIVGVFKDFILESPYQPTRPMLVYGLKSNWFGVVQIKLNGKNKTEANLKTAEATFKKYNPEYPFEYKFVDEDYAKKFESEQTTGKLSGIFSVLTIFISCLGLFGLATYMAENRIKEIGIRKVLGASVTHITALLSRDFFILILISFAIASPISWWLMHNWLMGYPYRTDIELWVFLLAAGLSFFIAFISVSYQSIKAAMANPVKSLRTE